MSQKFTAHAHSAALQGAMAALAGLRVYEAALREEAEDGVDVRAWIHQVEEADAALSAVIKPLIDHKHR